VSEDNVNEIDVMKGFPRPFMSVTVVPIGDWMDTSKSPATGWLVEIMASTYCKYIDVGMSPLGTMKEMEAAAEQSGTWSTVSLSYVLTK
jgi:hypothetical protein